MNEDCTGCPLKYQSKEGKSTFDNPTGIYKIKGIMKAKKQPILQREKQFKH